jgi:SAM-dependent methyltransferase
LYSQGDEVNWTAPVDSRRDWRIARDWIRKSFPKDSRILDVGCFDGGFLEPLVGANRCFGIEIHPAAHHRAAQKGIDIIGSDFSAIAGVFDCITAFDVIEHVERPKLLLENCLAAVNTGGWVIISSGNLDAFTFRLMASRYWYCTIAEHISFVSPTWFSGLAGALDFRIIKQTDFAHTNTSHLGRISEAANNLLYRFGGPAFGTLRKFGMGGKDVKAHPELADHPPVWGSARDHLMVVLQKR